MSNDDLTDNNSDIGDISNILSSLDNIKWDDKIYINASPNYTASTMYSTADLTTANIYGSGIGNITAAGSIGAAPYPTISIRDIMPDPSLRVDGDLIVKGKNIGEIIDKIEKRLSILVPDPKKLEKYEALKKAYEHYKLLESLVDNIDEEEK